MVQTPQLCASPPIVYAAAKSTDTLKGTVTAHFDWKTRIVDPRLRLVEGLCRACRVEGYVRVREGEVFEEWDGGSSDV